MSRLNDAKRLLLIAWLSCLLQLGASGAPALAQADDMLALIARVTALTSEGKFAEAIEVEKRVMAGIEKMAGPQHPLYLAQIAALGELHGMNGDYAEAERLHLDALARREALLGREHADVASSLASLANVQINTARYDAAEASLRRALDIRRKVLPPSSPDYGFTYVTLGRLYMMRSRMAEAEQAFQQALDLFQQHLPPDHLYFLVTINNLAEAKRALGRVADAERLLRQALAMSEKQLGPDNQFAPVVLSNLAQIYRQQGRFADAEALMRQELAITERTRGAEHLSVAISLNNLGTLLSIRGRPQDGVALLRRALQIEERILGPDHPDIGKTLNNIADALSWLGQPEETEWLLRRSLAIRERAHGAESAPVAVPLDNLATFLHGRRRYEEAEPLARRALAIRTATQPADHPELALSIGNLAALLDNLGKHAEARGLHERAAAIKAASVGENHPDFAISLSNLGANRLDERDWQGARAHFQRANAIWLSRRAALGASVASGSTGDQDVELKRFSDSFLGLIWAGFELQRTAGADERQALAEESFAALQWASLSSAANAVAKMSARIAAGSGAMSALVREQQDLTSELQVLDKTLIAAIATPPAARSDKGEADLRGRADAVRSRLAALGRDVAAQFPEFAAVAAPEPSSIAQLRKSLRPNEAFYAIAMTRGGSFAFVITPDAERWVRIERSHREIEDDVAALRCGLDAAAWAGAKSRCAELAGQSYSQADQASGKPPRFDLARAHALYRTLFGQVEDLIRGRQLIVVPTGALTQLPFHVLVTETPSSPSYRSAAWLARTTPVAVLPSINSLLSLRGHASTSASEAFLGIGNPLLDGPDKRYASIAAQARAKLDCAGAPSPVAQTAELRATVGRMPSSGNVVDPGFLRAQPPLPETADELCAVARDLKAPAASVLLGRNAVETGIKRLSADGALARVRVLHFATHGAMVGEVAGTSEPGLILTPPETASEADDGYLSASEIAALKLDADLVILSACNTAAGGADDAETLAGLARSFFYAGARAMLVSHWAVDSAATVKLITGALAGMARDRRIAPAEALNRAMLALIDAGTEGEAHPAYWAPFVVVGGTASGS